MANRRRRSVVTREGWYYLFILGFVILGSLLRNIQLMVGLSTILATAIILNWRWSKVLMRGLAIRPLPFETYWAGQVCRFKTEVENTRTRFTTFSLMLSQKFRVVNIRSDRQAAPTWYLKLWHWISKPETRHFQLIDAVHPGQQLIADVGVLFRERGEYAIEELAVGTHFPLGLVRHEWVERQERSLMVGPALGTLSQNWVEQMLGLGWQDSRSGQIARSGEDFFSLRPYTTGDSQRWIHWRASARHNSLLVRQFQRSQSKAFSLVVDLWADGSNKSLDACEKMLRVLATISAAVQSGRLDSVRLTLVGETESAIEFPASDAEWAAWHRAMAMARPHEEIGRSGAVWQRLATEATKSAGGKVVPIVWLSPMSIDQYVRELQESKDVLTEAVETASNPRSSDLNPSSRSKANDLHSVMLSNFWLAQPLIRSWLTPGDGWLSSWYLEPNTQGVPSVVDSREGMSAPQVRNTDSADRSLPSNQVLPTKKKMESVEVRA
ncbi:MAG: DUF58 domain-containing protein [Planctomycetaceae bacterium]|nr:DUF58 domain-containing protein [Planctomycetaceae bacterium]